MRQHLIVDSLGGRSKLLIFSTLFLMVLLTTSARAYTPLTDATCSLARATYYIHNGQGSCGFDSISNSNFKFDLNFGFAPNQAFYFGKTQCGECYQVIGPYGARDTLQTSPKPVIAMVTDYCPTQGNTQWCSGDMTHWDLRVGIWDGLVKGDRDYEPFLFTYQKVACPFDASTSPVSVQVVDLNDYYLSLRPFHHSLAITDTLLIKEQNGEFVSTKTKLEDFQFQYQPNALIKYPLTVRVTALTTGETIDITISSKPAKNSVHKSSKQFSYSSVTQNPVQKCSYYVEENVYDEKLYREVADNRRTADDWRIYNYNVNYNLKSTSNPSSGTYAISMAFTSYGSLQIARKTPIYKDATIALKFDIRSNQDLTRKLTVSFNGAQGQAGASNFYYLDTTTSWKTVTMYLNTSDIPAELNTIYLQQQAAESYTFHLDNIKWVLNEVNGPGADPSTSTPGGADSNSTPMEGSVSTSAAARTISTISQILAIAIVLLAVFLLH